MLKKHDNNDFSSDVPIRSGSSSREEDLKAHAFLFPIDETEEFHDPFSDLSLFLAKKIKQEISRSSSLKKWSRNIQTDLLKSILPDFNKKFPKYRLGGNALKKTWDKVLYYVQFIQKQKESLTADGKLNITYLIQQNLKNLLQNPNSSDLHPYTTAHNLAVKISECVATIDGERANLESLTKTIWAVQRHMIPKQQTPSPFDRYDQIDKFIVRFQLEEIAKKPDSTPDEVSIATCKKIETLKLLQRLKNSDDLLAAVSFVLAENLYPNLKLHKKVPASQIHELSNFVRNQLTEQKAAGNLSEEKDCIHASQKIFFLYKLASELSPAETKHNLETAVEYVYNLSQGAFSPNCPVLRPEVFTFINAEISNLKERKTENPLENVLGTLMKCFSDAKNLPKLDAEYFDEVEILIWKILSEVYTPQEKMPAFVKETLSYELANIYIDHPKESFQKILTVSLGYFRKLQTIDTTQLDRKSNFWSLQNDMICNFLHFDETTPLLKLITRVWKSEAGPPLNHSDFIEKVLAIYLKNNVSISGWKAVLHTRITIMYKYFWYNSLRKDRETAYDRFLKWHLHDLLAGKQKEFPETLIIRLEEKTKSLIPLAPFSPKHVSSFLSQS
jgi:hypothetical protein